jgi:hypothetical protein
MKTHLKGIGYKLVLLLACTSILFSLVGCGTRPPWDPSAQKFFRAIFSAKATEAAKMICNDGKVYVILAIKANWSDDAYKSLVKTKTSEQVVVSGKLLFSTNELKPYLPALNQALSENGYNVPAIDLDNFEGVINFGVKFDQFYLKYDDIQKNWCVDGKSYYSFINYLFQMVADSISTFPTPAP